VVYDTENIKPNEKMTRKEIIYWVSCLSLLSIFALAFFIYFLSPQKAQIEMLMNKAIEIRHPLDSSLCFIEIVSPEKMSISCNENATAIKIAPITKSTRCSVKLSSMYGLASQYVPDRFIMSVVDINRAPLQKKTEDNKPNKTDKN
jgi:hypothetical protein